MAVADVDVERVRLERMHANVQQRGGVAGHPEPAFRRVRFEHDARSEDVGLVRAVDRFPYVPDLVERLDLECHEAFNIQVQG